ncbi:UV radiation resistance-associated protein [Escovopsis weberi]|uniref:Autophagy-related protein 14 n=1 Tax=Escovopsis weberi TaxID=150374 RepID=A0A0M8MZ06_ESCWE|nr:UV radiation resistance-associated protein [Escovopsis weberi]
MSALSEPRRPRLLPQNRKLRHLKGLSLRNLSFAPSSHPRVLDDDAYPSQSPNQLEVLREAGELLSSQSSEGHGHGHDHDHDHEAERRDRSDARPVRPRPQSPRRASLSLAHATPATRQARLESLVDDIVGDVFFSLHVDSLEEPIYISEVRERSTNFNFQFFDFADQASLISRSCRVTVRLWAKRPGSLWIFLLEELIDLRELNFIGTLRDRKFPQNALIFHLEDGIYSIDFPSWESEPKRAAPIATSAYSALMKLANLENSIADAIETQQRIMDQINTILEQSTAVEPDTAGEEVALAQKYLILQRRANKQAKKEREERRESLRRRRAAIAQGRELQAQAERDITDNREKLETSRGLLEQTQRHIRGQRRRICSDLADIFPIIPIPNQPPLSFQICGITLPNSIYDGPTARSLNEDVLSAGLGVVTLLTQHLQYYLSCSLPYPLTPFGSRSHTRDDISLLEKDQTSRRDFPLYLPRGGSTAGQWRFEYAWFLLNKNIETLCASQGLKVVDIRHTLPNLKYLLYVCSAGTDEVPLRKKGGVRGLWAGRLRGRLSAVPSLAVDGDASSFGGSRRASFDSDGVSQHADSLRVAILKNAGAAEDGHGSGADDGAAAAGGSDAQQSQKPDRDQDRERDRDRDRNGDLNLLRFGEGEMKFTLRTKGLRENVAAK